LVSSPGHAPEAIANTANAEQYGLLVMGTHGHGSLGNLVLGSVATAVLARAKVAVLLIPSS
jgi:nucleotide-binding universal stress UspA family protein